MNKIFILFLSILSVAIAQDTTSVDTTWQNELVGSLGFSQAHFDNWTQGGENSTTLQLDLGGKTIRNSEIFTWTNSGNITFGNSKLGDAGTKKTIDELRFESLLSYSLDFFAQPYFALKAETQLAPGYLYDGDIKTQVSNFLDPGYFTQSMGLQYIPNKEASIRLGLAIKETITSDFPAPYTDDLETTEIEKTKVEPGVESVVTFAKKLSENTLFNSKVDLFNDFHSINATDIHWDSDITTQINKYFNVKLNVRLFYDRDISIKRQLNHSLLIGISYTFL